MNGLWRPRGSGGRRASPPTAECRGAVTAEFAVALPSVVLLLSLLLAGSAAGVTQLRVEEAARGGALLHRRDDLDERVPQRHHRVAQPEQRDPRIGIRLAQRQRRTELLHRRVQVDRRQHRLS